MIGPHVKPGVATEELDRICHDYIVDELASIPAPLNYRGFPKSICTSVNHVVCHGIPSERVLKNGDIVNVDITVIKDGYHGDTSRMFFVGDPSIMAERLTRVCFDAMWRGIRAIRPGTRLGDIGYVDPELRRGAALLGRPRVLRPRHRPRLPRGSAGAALRPARHGPRARARA